MRPVVFVCLCSLLTGCHGIAHRFARGDACCVTECPPPCKEDGEKRGLGDSRRAASQEVLLVARTVYVPYVQQEAVGVVRVGEAGLRRSVDAGDSDVRALEERIRSLEEQRDQLRSLIDGSRGVGPEKLPTPPTPYCPPPVCPPICPPGR